MKKKKKNTKKNTKKKTKKKIIFHSFINVLKNINDIYLLQSSTSSPTFPPSTISRYRSNIFNSSNFHS